MNRLDLLESDAERSLQGVPVEALAGKTVLITGASGIVGTHLLYGLQYCQRQLGLDIRVFGAVRREVPEHLVTLQDGGFVRFVRGDLTDAEFINSLPAADVIVHAATYGQPGMFMAEAVGTLALNTTCTLALLKNLLPKGKFLFVSSSEVYSGLADPPFTEEQIGTTTPTHARSCYIEAKRCGEAICNAYRNEEIDAKSARLCLAYGPGTRAGDKRVLNSFIERALRLKAIELQDQGRAKRTFCYIADATAMLWRVLLAGKQPVYNVGGISNTTVYELAQIIGELVGVPVRLPPALGDGMAGAPESVSLDLTRFSQEFGVRPFVDLKQGILKTIEWQRAIYA
jgi:UDP-glucuronate decarboxylase